MAAEAVATPAGYQASMDKADAPSDSGTLKRLEIEIADNGGFMVSVYRQPSDRKAKETMYLGNNTEKHAFTSISELNQFIDDTLGTDDQSAEAEAAPDPAAGGDMGDDQTDA